MTRTTTTAVERYQQSFSEPDQTTLLGLLAGYSGFTREASPWIGASSPHGAGSTTAACSTSAVSTSSGSPATSKTVAALEPSWPAG